jgi:hypothetical protein
VVSLLPRLKRRQRALVIGRFGLFGCPAQNLTELADGAQISRERARQIVNVALRKLRWWARAAAADPPSAERAWANALRSSGPSGPAGRRPRACAVTAPRREGDEGPGPPSAL